MIHSFPRHLEKPVGVVKSADPVFGDVANVARPAMRGNGPK
jgi:hypothetical protein